MRTEGDIEPLEWKLPPHAGEPANGYASRMAALNGFDLAYLASVAGLRATDIRSGGEKALRAVARFGGLGAAQEKAMTLATPRLRGRLDAELRGEKVVWGAVHTNFFRYCPHCIAADIAGGPADVPRIARTWLRLEWLIDQVRSCRVHGVRLFESGRADPGYAMDFAAVVDADILPRLADLRAAAVPVDPNPFEAWVVRRAYGTREPTSWLDAMPLHAAVATCEGLGISALHDANVELRSLSLQQWSVASCEGYRVASAGPEAVDRFLDTLVERARGRGVVALEDTYGYMFLSLTRTLSDLDFAPIRDVVREHAFENVPLPAGARVLDGILDRERVVNVHAAAKAAGTTWPTMRRMLERRGIACAPRGGLGDGGLTRTVVRMSEIEDLIAGHADSVGSTEFCDATGISLRHLSELASRGLVPVVGADRRQPRDKLRFRKADIGAFVDRLFAGAVDVSEAGPRQVSVGAAGSSAAANVGDVLDLVLNGRLAWKGALGGGRRFKHLLVDADEVRRLLRTEAPKTGYSKREVGNVVPGLRQEVVVALVARGHLTMAEEFCPVNRRRIPVVTRESVEAFARCYVSIAEIGQIKGIPARMALRILNEAGRKAVFDTSTAGAWIYERAEVLGDRWPVSG